MVVPARTRALLATPRKAPSPLRVRVQRPPTKRRRLEDESDGFGQDEPLNAKAGEQAVNARRQAVKKKQSPKKRKRALSVESDTGSWVPMGSDDGDEEMQFIDDGLFADGSPEQPH
jgi:hypothetical protein